MNLGGDTGKVFKVGVIVAALIVGLVLLNFIFRVALQLLPLAILVLAAYFGWRWLRNQANNPLAGLMSRLSSQPEDKAQEIRSQRYDEILSQSSRVQDVTFASVTPAEQPASATESATADDVQA